MINGIGGPVLLGTAVATFFTGSEFTVNKDQLMEVGMPVISAWSNPLHGLEAAFNVWNLCLGLAVFFLSRVQAILYFINNINDSDLGARCRKQLVPNALLFLFFFLAFLIRLMFSDGFAVDPTTGEVYMQPFKYLINLIEMPVILAVLLTGIVAVLFGIGKTVVSKKFSKGIWFCGAGTVLTVLSLFLIAGYNNTAYYPSTVDLQSSLTIFNSSSSLFTLKVMSYVSILVPFVLAYIFYAWRALDLHKIDSQEMSSGNHSY